MDQAVIRYLSSWKFGIDTRSVAVRFMVDEMILYSFSRSTLILPSYYHFIFAHYSFLK